MKNGKGMGALALAAIIATLAAQPADALAQGICETNVINENAAVDCVTSLSEDASGSVVTFLGDATMTVTFRQGQESATGVLLNASGGVHCLGPTITRRGEQQSVTCFRGAARFRVTVN